MEDHVYGTYQYPDDERRDRYGCISDASFYCVSYDAWFRNDPDRSYHIQHPVCDLSVAPKLKQTNRYTYEAALDLGASPVRAFFKVVFPDIVPGVLSGFMLAFTMSLDDFVITHFTKGPGIDTLSTKIYTEVRKGIKPEIYALSTIMFVTVLVLLILVNYSPKEDEEAAAREKSPQTFQSQERSSSAVYFQLQSVLCLSEAVFIMPKKAMS